MKKEQGIERGGKEKMKSRRIIIGLIISNIILIGVVYNFISKNGNIIKEKQVIKEMSESAQVTDLNNQINALNTEHTEYMNYIQACKTKIATALTNEGVTTSNQVTLETMAGNISKVLQARTSDATATAEDIVDGKTAWVNGNLVTGIFESSSNFCINVKARVFYKNSAVTTEQTAMEPTFQIKCENGNFTITLVSGSTYTTATNTIPGNGMPNTQIAITKVELVK